MHNDETPRHLHYWMMGYWFATGYWFAQPRDEWVPDRSQEFANYCSRRRMAYENGEVYSLPCVPDLWTEFWSEIVFAPPTLDTRATFDQCAQAGVDPTLRRIA